MDKLKLVEAKFLKESPAFGIGDTVRVFVKIPEGDKVRLHPFEGTVIGRKRGGINSSFTVRRVSFGEGIERVFPVHSPSIDHIEVVRKGKVGRSKLYYLRGKKGKQAKVISEAVV
ncbi:MAG: 50S ribosomal protein L19 [Candidatus Omnitrophica bacterium]|nr:50S ribosomal protein L19 [Candidatus Omnitrophota bacterium]